MRTTLTIDDDVLAAAKVLAGQQNQTVGKVLSDLACRSLRHETVFASRNGIPQLPMSNPHATVTLEVVNALRDGD